MGRKSTLSDKELADAIQRHLDGESIRSIAKTHNIGESSLRARISAQAKAIKHATEQIVSAHDAISALEIPAQITAHTRAHRLITLRDMQDDLAIKQTETALLYISAHLRAAKNKPDVELLDPENMKSAMAVGMVANTHSKIGMEIRNISAKEKEAEELPQPSIDTSRLSSAALNELLSLTDATIAN